MLLSFTTIAMNLGVLAVLLLPQETNKKARKRRRLLRRPLFGQYEKLMNELKNEDAASFRNFLRMEPAIFRELLERVGPGIEKRNTSFRKALDHKLAVILGYLALAGKHIAIRCPPRSGSIFYNNKGLFPILLMALVDGNYQFLLVDVGPNAAGSDGGVFDRTDLREALENGTIGLPPPEPLPNDDVDMCYFIVGYEAFPL